MADTIVVVGSVAWDEVVELDRPLQPGAHNQGRARGRRIGGGAANTALALVRGGHEVAVLSAVGNDDSGRELLAALENEGVSTHRVGREAAITTRSMVFLEATGARTIVNLTRATVALPKRLDEPGSAAVYVRSSDPALAPLLRDALEHCLVVAHVPPVAIGVRPAHILVGSVDDLDAAFLIDPWRSGRRVAGEALQWVVITLGADGVLAYGADETLWLPAPRVATVDSTGAGDVFAAGLIHGLVRSRPMVVALRCAVRWGAASVQYEGTIPPTDFPGSNDGG